MSPNSLFDRKNPLLFVGGLAILLVLGYALFAASPYLLGPSLTITIPEADGIVSTPTVTVSGKTSRVTYVALNGQPIPLLEDGTFTVERAFPRGYTVLVIEARDRFDREVVQTVRFLHTNNPPDHGQNEEEN